MIYTLHGFTAGAFTDINIYIYIYMMGLLYTYYQYNHIIYGFVIIHIYDYDNKVPSFSSEPGQHGPKGGSPPASGMI